MQTVLPQSFFAVLTGAINSGKSFQLASVLTAEVDGERFALPCAVLLAESSGEGTLGEVLLDHGACVVWPCSSCEQATEALLALFPESGPLTLGRAKQAAHKALCDRADKDKAPRPPAPQTHPRDAMTLRALAVDTVSTLYNGSVNEAYRQLLVEAGGKPGVNPGGKKGGDARYNDPRELHKFAAKRCGDMLDRLNGIAMAHRGLLVLVTCHTGPAMQSTGQPGQAICVGEAPMLGGAKEMAAGIDVPGYSKTWDALAAKANVIWHCFETVPDLRGGSVRDINARASEASADGVACRGVITQKAKYEGRGPVLWVKRQGGDGPLGIFAQLPAYWHPAADVPDYITAVSPTPNLGRVLAYAIRAHREQSQAAAE